MEIVHSYRAQVISHFHNGSVQHWTYVGARTAEEAKAKLEREGYEVLSLEVLVLA